MKRLRQELGKTCILVAIIIAGMSSPLFAAEAVTETSKSFNYEGYTAVLKAYVNAGGMVNYKALKANRAKLDLFQTQIGNLDPNVYKQWSDGEKVAFWINAYNAFTLEAILNHYPIKPTFFGALLYPDNSIRQIPGVWDELKFPVMGREMTLNEIEHQTLRKDFNEPRIHMALVCAAMGCPPLRNEPYTGEKLDVQLDDQARRFLQNRQKFRIDRDDAIVYLSPIFKWYGEDFIKTYGTDEKFAGHGQSERAVLNFISKFLDQKDAEYLVRGDYQIQYLDYDWTLNEQSGS